MNHNTDYTGVPYGFCAEEYAAYTPPIAHGYHQDCVRSCPRPVHYNLDSALLPSPPFPWDEGLQHADVHTSAGPSIQWPLPAFGHSVGGLESEPTVGLLTPPSAQYMGFNAPPSPPAPCHGTAGWVPPLAESMYSAGPSNAPGPVPDFGESWGSGPAFPSSESLWDEGQKRAEVHTSAGPSIQWPLPASGHAGGVGSLESEASIGLFTPPSASANSVFSHTMS
ncbi:hypothetical protein HYPSUDRAFT_48073 [Hypholoma sublateritium FD-334 SS-4]|uniref:Uncharacterized protein n=1 Tax=Hypholoma sublateritium (strain FD-334 SS-4) TaxID=945553 RepID=A0A0D2KME0_HYPSF|nr:hypothetical protein HYPSUDRAFT_48073 [Hypholoma sublateritium FD-334 SS-4]